MNLSCWWIWFVLTIVNVGGEYILHTSPKQQIFEGTKCFPHSTYPADVCSVATKSCCCSSTCVMWQEGKLMLANKSVEHIPNPCRVSNFTGENGFVKGGWYTYPNNCEFSLFDPIEADTILQNHLLIFAGDSMVRQLFHRLLWHLRGFDEVVEHFYHANAIYARNGNQDRMVVGTEDLHGTKHFELPENPLYVVPNPTFMLVYIFDPLLKDPDLIATMLKPEYAPGFQKVLITGMHYWFRENMPDEPVLELIDKFVSTTAVVAAAAAAPGTKPIIPIWYPNWSPPLLSRQVAFLQHAEKAGYSILPSIELANSNVFAVNFADKHYQCMYMKKSHEQITLKDFKTPPNTDCRDLFNMNLIQIILNIVLGAQKKDAAPVIVSSERRKLLQRRERYHHHANTSFLHQV